MDLQSEMPLAKLWNLASLYGNVCGSIMATEVQETHAVDNQFILHNIQFLLVFCTKIQKISKFKETATTDEMPCDEMPCELSMFNHFIPTDQYRYLCKQCRPM